MEERGTHLAAFGTALGAAPSLAGALRLVAAAAATHATVDRAKLLWHTTKKKTII